MENITVAGIRKGVQKTGLCEVHTHAGARAPSLSSKYGRTAVCPFPPPAGSGGTRRRVAQDSQVGARKGLYGAHHVKSERQKGKLLSWFTHRIKQRPIFMFRKTSKW